MTRSASWGTYEDIFREAVREFSSQGITTGVFGDIDLDEHHIVAMKDGVGKDGVDRDSVGRDLLAMLGRTAIRAVGAEGWVLVCGWCSDPGRLMLRASTSVEG